jgi:hypothetical protein
MAAALLLAERRQAVDAGLAELQGPHRELLLLIFADPPISQRQISLLLGIPTQSIGPTRARTLRKLRTTTSLRAFANGPRRQNSPAPTIERKWWPGSLRAIVQVSGLVRTPSSACRSDPAPRARPARAPAG